MDWIWLVVLTVALLTVAGYGINSLLLSTRVTLFPLLLPHEQRRNRSAAAGQRWGGSTVCRRDHQGALSRLRKGKEGGEDMVSVNNIMKREPLRIHGRESVRTAAAMMTQHGVGSLLVEDGWGEVQGIVTETDIVRRMVASDLAATTTAVEQIMSAPLITIDRGRSLEDADELMHRHHVRHLAVTEEGKIVGILSVRDLLRPIGVEFWESA
jgi:CBS domain-containing protein